MLTQGCCCCAQAVGIFQALLVQVRKSANLALAARNAIAEATICPILNPFDDPEEADIPSLQNLCDDIELHYTQVSAGQLQISIIYYLFMSC